MSGKHRVRKTPFVQVDSKTVNNPDISFRAIGVLAWLLDKPEDWDVRSQAIANSKPEKEGRGAVRTALKELGAVGHYRIERRQLRNGTFEMGTATSYYPDPEWAAQYAEYDGKPVPMLEQADGSFKVKRKDGALVADGFESDPKPPAGDDSDEDEDDVSAGQTGDREMNFGTEVQKPVPGSPVPGSPDAGSPNDGFSVAINRRTTQEDHSNPPSSLRSDGPPSEQPALVDVEQPTEPTEPVLQFDKPVVIPDDFAVTPRMRAWFVEKGHGQVINGVEETEAFVDYWRSLGKVAKAKKADWEATWRTWMTRQAQRSRPRGGTVTPISTRHNVPKDSPGRAKRLSGWG